MSDGEEESKDHDDLYTAPAAQNTAKKSLLVDDEDDDFFKNLMAIPSEEEDPPVPDEEFPELIARARDREQLKAEKSLSGGSASRALTDDIFQESEAMVVDPVVEILVTSEIEGTKPMMFKRKISQTLKQVREVWCDKQIHEHSKKAGVFLTWRGKKMFDSITCAILGLRAGIDGNVTSNNNALDDYGRIHLEAWTEDLYIASQRRLEQGHGEADAEAEIQETTHVEKINLSLQAKGLEPITLKVKSTTLIEKLIGVVRRQQDIPGDKDVQLFFDGDKLDPSARIEDTELGDMDTVEIHVR
jgi:hypothetical protein